MAKPTSDSQCVRLALDGHPEAFGDLVERYERLLLGHLGGRLRDRHLAEEAAQEAFVRAYHSLNALRKPESFFAWLVGISERVAKECLRGERRRRETAETLANSPRGADATPDYDLERAVSGLPGRYRDVILLKYYGGLSSAEIARRLGAPQGTVTKRLSRAYAMLRKSLSRREDPAEKTEV